jgi:hypothetical protein
MFFYTVIPVLYFCLRFYNAMMFAWRRHSLTHCGWIGRNINTVRLDIDSQEERPRCYETKAFQDEILFTLQNHVFHPAYTLSLR